MVRILLIEDHVAFDRQFEDIFQSVDKFLCFEDLQKSNDLRPGWDYAFVDFDLGPGHMTGFSVLEFLRQHSPDTKVIVYTALADNSRILYAMAAYHWFGAWAIRNKRGATDEILIALRDEGSNPTPPRYLQVFENEAWRVDTLFPEPAALELWRIWNEYRGTAATIAKAFTHFGKKQVEGFSVAISAAVPEIRARFAGLTGVTGITEKKTSPEGKRDNKGITMPFAQENSYFFNAPELREVLTRVKPWDNKR